MDIDTFNIFIKSFFINIFSFIIFFKINNYAKLNNVKKIIIGIIIVLLTFLYYILRSISDILSTIIILYLLESIILSNLLKLKLSNTLISSIIAISISYFFFIISGTLEFFPQMIFNISNKIINLLLTLVIELILLILILKVKRLKNGLLFLQKENEYMEITIINISAIVIFVYGLIGNNFEKIVQHIYFYFIILGIFMFIILQKTLIMYYKQKLLDKTVKEYGNEIKEKDEIIAKLSNEKFNISKLNHEFYNRQKALELKVAEMKIEVGEEIGVLERIKDLTNEYSNKLEQIKGKPKLPLTNIEEIDDIFKYMQTECYNNNIEFKLQIETNINKLVNRKISKNNLETLIGDHIKDAIIAINSSNNKYKSILVILGIKDDSYELCICDTGIEFEIKTLLKLGLEAVTTHKDIGGSGIGFMTTFETLKECKASLIIKEINEERENDYTKSVIIRFDDKNEYKICSYRANEIKKEYSDDRIIIEKV